MADIHRALSAIDHRETSEVGRGLGDFTVPLLPATTRRFWAIGGSSGGDGAILSSQSGMGKSSIVIQAAVTWALGRDFFGIKPARPLVSLICQSEDSEGDVGEVWESIRQMMELSPAEVALVSSRVRIVTDRVNRGERFVTALRGRIQSVRPDLVFVNPLMGFFGGNINDAEEVGRFLREGLNALNDPGSFAYFLVHHTSKPPNQKDQGQRRWSEVMYDMAGSAELTNWARAILSLQPAETRGEFNLVAAKRGMRAGATIMTGEAEQFEEVVTSVPLQHTSRKITPAGHDKEIPAIFWERRKPLESESNRPEGQRAKKFTLKEFLPAFPNSKESARAIRAVHRVATGIRPISPTAFYDLRREATDAGIIRVDKSNPILPKVWIP